MSPKRGGSTGGEHLGALLYDYVSGRLVASEARGLEAHVKKCHACRDEAHALRLTLQLARKESFDTPAWLSKRTYERVVAQARYERARAAEARVPWWRKFVPQLATAGALAAAAVVAVVVLRPMLADAARWTAVRGAKTAALTAPPVAKAAQRGKKIGNGVVLALGKALEVTLGF